MTKRKQSLGEMISTVCFAGVALVWFLYGMEYFKSGEKIKATVLFFCSILCFFGSFRFQIAAFFKIIQNDKK